jgi:hypothetical protein
MGKVAATFLTLFCGLILFVLARSGIALVSGDATFGDQPPMAYVSFGLIALFAGYGFYAGCRALVARKPSATENDFKPIRTIGWAMVIFGCLGLYTVGEIAAVDSTRFVIRFVLYGTACSLLGGLALLYFFRRRT